jgi:hypothetical protein
MSRGKRWLVVSAALLLQGCDINYATFVTSTHLGIKADVKTEQIAIGIGRTDVFVGPGYPEKGTAPSVFGYLKSNAEVFSPQVTQLYATGAAADAVTQQNAPSQPVNSTPSDLSGVRRPLVFGTNTDIGLKVGFVANAPSIIDFGYNREELSIIPLQPNLAQTGKDIYAPVLAALTLNVAANTPTSSSLALGQFFATGTAAINLAGNDKIKKIFTEAARDQVNQASLEAARKALITRISLVQTYLDGTDGYVANCRKLKASPAFHAELWDVADPCALSETDFINKLNTRPDLTSATINAIAATP